MRAFKSFLLLFVTMFFAGRVLCAMVIQLPYEPVTLDPASVEDGVGFRVLSVLSRGLMRYDANGKLQLGLAASHSVDAQKHRHIFKLKEGLKWSDGVPLEAEHFVYEIKRALDPKKISKFADQLYFIRGARDYKAGRLTDFSKVGVHALSKTEIAFDLDKGFGIFPHILALPVALPFRPDMESLSQMPTTGPYFLKQWTHDVRIDCAKNDHYKSEGGPESVTFEIIPDDSTARGLFEQGRIDVLTKINALELPHWKKSARVLDLPYGGIYYFAFDLRNGAWGSMTPDARRRLSQAIDRDAIVQSVDAVGSVARSWTIPFFEPVRGCCSQDFLKAHPPHGTEPLPSKIRLVYDSNSRNQTIAERVQEDLKKKLGIEVQLRSRDWKSYLGALSAGSFESAKGAPVLYRMGWLTPILDAYGNFMIFHSTSPHNYSGWSSPRVDKLLDELGMVDPSDPAAREHRARLVHALSVEVSAAGVFMPIYFFTQQYVLGPKVQRFTANPLGQLFF